MNAFALRCSARIFGSRVRVFVCSRVCVFTCSVGVHVFGRCSVRSLDLGKVADLGQQFMVSLGLV